MSKTTIDIVEKYLIILQKIMKLPLRLFYFFVGKFLYRDDRMTIMLHNCFPSYRSAFKETMNQFYRILRKSSSYDIQGIIIEPTNLCNLHCRHCTPQGLPNEKKGYMSFELFKKILDDNPQITGLILTRNGEPMLHPHIFDMIAYAHRKNIYVILYTNGMLLDDEKINELFESNLDELNFSLEGIDEFYRYNRGKDYSVLKSIIKRILEERNKRKTALKIGINTVVVEDPAHAQGVKRAWGGVVDHITFESLMGKRAVPRHSPCRTLWRNLAITWDGNVLPCCVDMEGKLIVGNVNDKSLKEIFNSLQLREIRKRHLNGDFPSICKYCDSHFG